MAIKVAINGFGRIGRNVFRAMFESGQQDQFEVVAVNDLGDAATNAHLLQYDTAHGRFGEDVSVDGDAFVVGTSRVKVLAERDPAKLPWAELGVDVVMECTGFFTSKEKASAHLAGGAKKVIISAPGGKDVDATVVYGVNHDVLTASDTVISNASCTTNCLAPLVKPLHDAIGVVGGLMTTIHAYTNDQVLTGCLPLGSETGPLRNAVDDSDQDRCRSCGGPSATGTQWKAGWFCDPGTDDQCLDG